MAVGPRHLARSCSGVRSSWPGAVTGRRELWRDEELGEGVRCGTGGWIPPPWTLRLGRSPPQRGGNSLARGERWIDVARHQPLLLASVLFSLLSVFPSACFGAAPAPRTGDTAVNKAAIPASRKLSSRVGEERQMDVRRKATR